MKSGANMYISLEIITTETVSLPKGEPNLTEVSEVLHVR